uniref:Protein crumbs n=1 Tax=Trichogramma kaykai TaxID=54128 RepID=A0ABD2VS18_9HYME
MLTALLLLLDCRTSHGAPQEASNTNNIGGRSNSLPLDDLPIISAPGNSIYRPITPAPNSATATTTTTTTISSPSTSTSSSSSSSSSSYVSQREAYFDGSAKLQLRSFVSVHRHSGLSFRTCEPGRLFEQKIEPNDSIGLHVDHEGLVFIARVQGRRLEGRLNAKLLDNVWHNVNLFFRLGNLTLSAAGHAQILANATYNSDILTLPDESDANGTLMVGEGFRGCILQGPGILFNESINTNAVFGECPLNARGCGHQGSGTSGIAALTPSPPTTTTTTTDWCETYPCLRGGTCISRPEPIRYECQCYPRYSGNICQIDNGSPCLMTNLCQNGATCHEDSRGDYSCQCAPGWTGRRCDQPATGNNNHRPVVSGPCDLRPCRNEANCYESPDRSEYTCSCRPGFTGRNCEIDIDDCQPNPCRNHGNCTDRVNGFSCRCDRTGYTGRVCEIDIDECVNNPCLNKGTCYNNYGGYQCACQAGFEGPNCEHHVNECLSHPCKNGGNCIDEVGGYRCNCTGTGFAGEHCELPLRAHNCDGCPSNGVCVRNHLGQLQCACKSGYVGAPPNCTFNHCASNPCANGGTCTNFKDRYECQCTPEWKGPHCRSVKPNWCPICHHGGTCVDTKQGPACSCTRFWTGLECKEPITCLSHRPCKRAKECRDLPTGYYCVCESGWTGPECSIDIDECMSEPCLNGGICIDQLDNYYCQCLSGYAGKSCQINVDECDSQPCQNGGTCQDRAKGYSCLCPAEFAGDNCELPLDGCARNPCKNNATCTLSAKSKRDFVCKCPAGYEGKFCDVDVDECVGVNCPDGRVCVDAVAGYDCKCPEGTREPNCAPVPDPCAADPCDNGVCVKTDDANYRCECPPGYAGPQCTDINECKVEGLCNNGICLNTNGSYDCFCRPGYSGDHCEFDIDECLCAPCQNNATCIDKINGYECRCPPGYEGKVCAQDIDECHDQPCQNNATCVNLIAKYSCECAPGFTGHDCEINIDDCADGPCKNNGHCIDGVNSFACDCDDTGFEGDTCEINIDDCEPQPCENGATCVDAVKDYNCTCWDGYTGKNCEIDVNECENSPCQYNGTCFERSNVNLYKANVKNRPAVFNQEFSYANASGYECDCVPGVTGKNCEININECESDPCVQGQGQCIDRIGGYTCECDDGFEGDICQVDIDECKRYEPCEHGTCFDRRADYHCSCDPLYGGKNCSVLLQGCQGNACMNNGTCWPYLVDETEHKFNCTCPNGFYGEICDRVTTMSLSGSSLVTVNTSREEGYDIQFRFRTTLPNGLLAMGTGLTYYILELSGGKLNLRSSLLNKWNGVFIGSGLNDSNWQKVFVAINATHLVLSANEEQTIYPINLNDGANVTYTSFPTTYIGSTVTNLRKLPKGSPYFIGCAEDVIINGEWIYSGTASKHVEMLNVEAGCPREEQCAPNPCKNNGHCTDCWRDFSCKCERPFLGQTCQYNMTAATFGYEDIRDGYVTVRVNDQARKAVRQIVDISMFVRTRESTGDVFYLGSEAADPKEKTFIAAQLEGGELLVRIQFNGTEAYTVGGVKLNDGNNHLIQVVRNVTLVQVKINGTEYFRKTISASGQLNVTVLHLGGLPQTSRFIRQVESRMMSDAAMQTQPPHMNFKGVIQDVQISNGIDVMVVEFYPLKTKDIPVLVQFGNVTFDHEKVLEGVISDNVCASSPCHHNGTCHVTWNDFWCQCPRGYTGKTCQEMEFCQLQDCPQGSRCQNLDDGYECIANATFDGLTTEFTYVYGLNENLMTENNTETAIDQIRIDYRSNNGGTLMHMAAESGDNHFTVSVYQDSIVITWKLQVSGSLAFGKPQPDGNWTTVMIKLKNNSIEALYENAGDDVQPQTSDGFNYDAWYDLLSHGTITLGAMRTPVSNIDMYKTIGEERHISRDSIMANSVELAERKLTTAAPPKTLMSGEPFKGCIGEVRIGSMLMHYFTYEEVYQNANFTPLQFLKLQQQDNTSSLHESIGCRLCFESQCKNNGHCLDQLNSYICECPAGYEEEDCSVDIDECLDNQCSNGSTCLDQVANYTCLCKDGWQGRHCEIDIDECETLSPCQHNGKCVNEPGSFNCECGDKFIGELCEQYRLITCADYPCRNGSTCADVPKPGTPNNFTCSCLPGYEGDLCDTPYCELRKCQNNGTCFVVDQQPPKCLCPAGFEGPYCDVNIDDCAAGEDGNVRCKNEGRCIDGVNEFTCDCSYTGYEGPDCSIDIDECERGQNCNHGECQNLEGSYRCKCQPDYCGLDCTMMNLCVEEYCQNGGTCTCKDDGQYHCACQPGYKGLNCTETEHYLGSRALDIAVIVGPIVAIIFLIAAGSLIALFMMARKKRATRGTYSPSAQEFSNPRVEMDNVMKPPPEERLI